MKNKVIAHYYYSPCCWLGKLPWAKTTGLSHVTCKYCLRKNLKVMLARFKQGENGKDNWFVWAYKGVIWIRQRLDEK